MAESIRSIVSKESPVDISVLHERLRNAWDIGRVGQRIRANIDGAIRLANVLRDGDFLIAADHSSATVRTPTQRCQRDISQVHVSELAVALVRLVGDAGGISQDELTTRVTRIYGWTRRGSDITARMQGVIRDLLEKGALTGTSDNLTPIRRP
jgi:hypothetical protein